MSQPRSLRSLPTGARLGLTLAVLVLLYAAFKAVEPVDITATGGTQFRCGSVLDPPSGPLQQGSCGGLVDRQRAVVIFVGIGALVVAAGALFTFAGRRDAAAAQPAGPGGAAAEPPARDPDRPDPAAAGLPARDAAAAGLPARDPAAAGLPARDPAAAELSARDPAVAELVDPGAGGR